VYRSTSPFASTTVQSPASRVSTMRFSVNGDSSSGSSGPLV
jgi:hypothetical protein